MHGFWQIIPEVLLHNKSRAAFAALAVDADNGLILPAYVRRVNGQIGHLPIGGITLGHVIHALLDGVLVRTGKSGEYQLAGIRMPLVNLHLGAGFIDMPDVVDIGEVQLGVHALGIHIHGHYHNIRITGALAVAEEGALHPLCASHETQLCGRYAAAPVIVGVEADDSAVPAL